MQISLEIKIVEKFYRKTQNKTKKNLNKKLMMTIQSGHIVHYVNCLLRVLAASRWARQRIVPLFFSYPPSSGIASSVRTVLKGNFR